MPGWRHAAYVPDLRQLITSQSQHVFVIHYASSSIYASPVEITCITIAAWGQGQSESFSRVSHGSERDLLVAFADYVRQVPATHFIAWNMGDSTFGIQVIKRRYEQLTSRADFPISASQIIDLDEIFGADFGKKYCNHPKLKNMAEANRISMLDFKSGADEVELLRHQRYREIELSTNRKVWMIHDLAEKYVNKTLAVPRRAVGKRIALFLGNTAVQGVLGFGGLLLAVLGFAAPAFIDAFRMWIIGAGVLLVVAAAVTYLIARE